MAQIVLAAKNREGKGSPESRRLRKSGRIPGVLYGRTGNSVPIDLDALEFTNGIKHISESTIVKVEIDGQSHDAFVKSTQRNITDGKILHVDFYEIEKDTILRTRVSVHVNGSPVGVRNGGILEIPVHEIEVECLPKDLPERIDVDISGLNVNQSIHVRDIPLNEGVRLMSAGDQVLALVKFAKAEEAAVSEEAAAGAAPAAGAAAPAAESAEKK